MSSDLDAIVALDRHPLADRHFRDACQATLTRDGVLVLPAFLTKQAVARINAEGDASEHLAYYTQSRHNIYLAPDDPQFAPQHPRNRLVVSSKGCITTDQIPAQSPLKTLYDAGEFRKFLCAVLDENALYEYADPLSSINLHYAREGQELGWHFDNSSFAITLLLQKPDGGGEFEFVRDVRATGTGEMGYEAAAKVLDASTPATRLAMNAGDLVLFRGRDSMHRVTPVEGERVRRLVVLAYNTEPGIALSESARMTFYGRLQ